MASTGFLTGSYAINSAGGFYNWTNPSYAIVNDGNYATNFPNGAPVADLQVFFNSAAIPTGAAIDGVQVSVGQCKASTFSRTFTVAPIVSNSASGSLLNFSSATTFNTYASYFSFGSSVDLWGLTAGVTYTGTELGVSLRIPYPPGGWQASVSSMSINVHYTPKVKECYVKDGGVWKPIDPFYVRDAGVWKEQEHYVKDAGIWKKVYG